MSSSDDVSTGPSSSSVNASLMAREKNRLTLRSYLHSLMGSSTVASSPVLRSFLLSSPTELTPEEVEDCIRREEADRLRDEGKKRFAAEVAARVESLRVAVRSVKGNMMGRSQWIILFSWFITDFIHRWPNQHICNGKIHSQFQGSPARLSCSLRVGTHHVRVD
jgi:hypothetical protein